MYSADYPQVAVNALPDTLAWRDELSFTKPYVELYYRHPAYSEYPVVGVTWQQSNAFNVWRTQLLNSWRKSHMLPFVQDFRLPSDSLCFDAEIFRPTSRDCLVSTSRLLTATLLAKLKRPSGSIRLAGVCITFTSAGKGYDAPRKRSNSMHRFIISFDVKR